MIKPQEKNKSIRAYCTGTRRDSFNAKARKFGFASTSKMILTACDFLLKTLESGATSTVQPKETAFIGWHQKKSIREIKHQNRQSGKFLIIQEIREVFKTGFKFVKYSDEEINIQEIVQYGIKE